MTTYKVLELTGAPLDEAVASLEFLQHTTVIESRSEDPPNKLYVMLEKPDGRIDFKQGRWTPSARWDQGGPIIERERVLLEPSYDGDPFDDAWCAMIGPSGYDGHYRRVTSWRVTALGPTPLIAAMRAYVASKLGETIEL